MQEVIITEGDQNNANKCIWIKDDAYLFWILGICFISLFPRGSHFIWKMNHMDLTIFIFFTGVLGITPLQWIEVWSLNWIQEAWKEDAFKN